MSSLPSLITFKAPHLSVTYIAPIYLAKSSLYQAFLPKLSTGCKKSLGDNTYVCTHTYTKIHTYIREKHQWYRWYGDLGQLSIQLTLSSAPALVLSCTTFSIWCMIAVMTLSYDLVSLIASQFKTGNSGFIVTWYSVISLSQVSAICEEWCWERCVVFCWSWKALMRSPCGLSHDSPIGAYQRHLYLPEIPSDPRGLPVKSSKC